MVDSVGYYIITALIPLLIKKNIETQRINKIISTRLLYYYYYIQGFMNKRKSLLLSNHEREWWKNDNQVNAKSKYNFTNQNGEKKKKMKSGYYATQEIK